MPELASQPTPIAAGLEGGRGGAGIASVGISVPGTVVPNRPVAARLGVSERWIVERTGVRERHVADPEERLASFASEASERALAGAGVSATELDLVLVATMSHEDLTPNAAPLVAAEIGADRAGALDVGAACTGFLSAVSIGAAQIEAGRATAVLAIGADLVSRLTDRDDRSTAGLFGDGAGAVVLRALAGPGRIGPVMLGADGRSAGLIRATREEGVIRMKGPDTFRAAVDRLSEATNEALLLAGRELADIDLFVYHQANSRIIGAVGERLGLPAERVIDCIGSFGNTSAATIPIALAEAESAGALSEGATVLLAAFGGGLTWGATVVEWGCGDA